MLRHEKNMIIVTGRYFRRVWQFEFIVKLCKDRGTFFGPWNCFEIRNFGVRTFRHYVLCPKTGPAGKPGLRRRILLKGSKCFCLFLLSRGRFFAFLARIKCCCLFLPAFEHCKAPSIHKRDWDTVTICEIHWTSLLTMEIFAHVCVRRYECSSLVCHAPVPLSGPTRYCGNSSWSWEREPWIRISTQEPGTKNDLRRRYVGSHRQVAVVRLGFEVGWGHLQAGTRGQGGTSQPWVLWPNMRIFVWLQRCGGNHGRPDTVYDVNWIIYII